jgi:hypothetical protein
MLYRQRMFLLVPQDMTKLIIGLVGPLVPSFEVVHSGDRVDRSLQFTVFPGKTAKLEIN